ncbi:MAG: hypothetical protein C0601_10200 [Candidatus Muiribacterium halophilum]|uniref:Type II/III secretion system secretin-like domain-containing protein n=1 Tax=Muiribacterium halophilum TaxID=2053465 RepID=A0A2N5ZCQ4_MUIH1|nr:MAG: hypothetical protein C0601_10200 [Candidatus Muirbacterium halophilum]
MYRKFWISLLLVLFTISAFAAGNEILDIRYYELPNTIDFEVSLAGSDFEYYPSQVGNLIRIDFPNTRFTGEDREKIVHKGSVMRYKIDYLDNDQNTTRLLITTIDPVHFTHKKNASQLRIKIAKTKDATIDEEKMQVREDKVNKIKAQALYEKGTVAMRMKEWEKAYNYLRDALVLDPENSQIKNAHNIAQEKFFAKKVFDQRLKKALEAYSEGDYEMAINMLKRFNEQYGNTADSNYYLGKSYFSMNEYRAAKKALLYVKENHPGYEFISSVQELLDRIDYYLANDLSADDLIDFSAENKPITEVISSLLYGTGFKYDIEEGIDRYVTVDIRNKSLKEAIKMVVDSVGLDYEVENRLVKIRKKKISDNFLKKMGFQNMMISDVMNAVADFMNINIIISPDVDATKKITFFIENAEISIDEFFDLLLKSNDLTAIKYNETTFFITDTLKAKHSNYQHKFSKLFKLQYISPEEAMNALLSVKKFREVLDFDNISVFDLDTNSTVMQNNTEIEDKSMPNSEIEDAISKLGSEDLKDVAATALEELNQTYVNRLKKATEKTESSQKITTKKSMEEKLDENHTHLTDYNVKVKDMLSTKRKVKAIYAYETRDNLDMIGKFLDSIDIKRKQVLISMKVIEIDSNYSDELGVNTTFDGNSNTLNVSKLKNISSIKLESTLSFLEEKNKAKILASPSIRALDGHSAKIDIFKTVTMKTKEAEKVAVASTTGINNTSTNSTTGEDWKVVDKYKEVELGLKMEVMPFVNDNNEITIDISVNETAENGTTPEGIMIIAERNTDTIIRLNDGESVIMGGLISKRDKETRKNVPLFSQLPGVGRFFRHRESSNSENEMVIFISAYVVDNDNGDNKIDLTKRTEQKNDFSKVVDELRYKLGK